MKEARSTNKELRERSGEINSTDAVVSFLYELMRDVVPPGKVEELVRLSTNVNIEYTNGWLAVYAKDLCYRLTGSWPKEAYNFGGDAQVTTDPEVSKQWAEEAAAKHQAVREFMFYNHRTDLLKKYDELLAEAKANEGGSTIKACSISEGLGRLELEARTGSRS